MNMKGVSGYENAIRGVLCILFGFMVLRVESSREFSLLLVVFIWFVRWTGFGIRDRWKHKILICTGYLINAEFDCFHSQSVMIRECVYKFAYHQGHISERCFRGFCKWWEEIRLPTDTGAMCNHLLKSHNDHLLGRKLLSSLRTPDNRSDNLHKLSPRKLRITSFLWGENVATSAGDFPPSHRAKCLP